MIISHKYKFIFIKPTKVAGTSVELGLSKFTSKYDIVTPVSTFSKKRDGMKYVHQPKNYQGFYNHDSPKKIKSKLGDEIWNSYYKITIIRNPWDLIVSRYHWEKERSFKNFSYVIKRHRIKENLFNFKSYFLLFWKLMNVPINYFYLYKIKKGDFEFFIKHFRKYWKNTRYYFSNDGNLWCDYYIRFEYLNEDYETLCKTLGLEYKPLMKTKNKTREKTHYSKYYNQETKLIVEKMFKKEINYFGYKFENK